MADPWQILRDAGLPIAAATTGGRPTTATLAASARAAMSSGATGREVEALAAWLFAWRDHWPSTFAGSFGTDVAAVVGWAAAHAVDDGRYRKLRRIAIENLATIL